MNDSCQIAIENVGASLAFALRAADCVASDVTTQAFGRQFAPGGALDSALTILLTLYVAFFAISLMLGRSSLSVRALLPRILTIGLVLTFATSWVAFRSVLGNLLIAAPDYLATLLSGSDGSATAGFASKLDVVFLAVQEASAGQSEFDSFSPAGMMWMGATMFLLGTVGLLVTARIGLAILVALGPIFVVMALFEGTRGLFTGWLKGVVMLALTPLIAVLAGGVMLELAVPVLSRLMEAPGIISQQAAMAFFVLGAVHLALMALAIKVAAVMVSNWRVFGLAPSKKDQTPANGEGRTGNRPAAPNRPAAYTNPATSHGARQIALAGPQQLRGANDGETGPIPAPAVRTAIPAPLERSSLGTIVGSTGLRNRGIGMRFRPVQPLSLKRAAEGVR